MDLWTRFSNHESQSEPQKPDLSREDYPQTSVPVGQGPRGQRQRRLSPELVHELVDAYVAGGTTINKLAEEYGIHRTTVMEHLKRAGASGRRRK